MPPPNGRSRRAPAAIVRMSRLLLLAVVGSPWVASCATVETEVRAGYLQLNVDGNVALATGSSATGVEQDLRSAFGLGDERGSPFVRADFDFGGPVLSASGFWFRDDGTGRLNADFGGLVGTPVVTSDLEIGCAKLAAVWDVEIGPVTLSPGLAFDAFDFEFRASDLAGNSEVIDEVLGVPMLLLRGGVQVGPAELLAEIGYIEAPMNGETSRFLDAELALAVEVASGWSVFGGYRFIDVDGNGDTETQSFAVDVQLRGWTIGGAVAF